MYYIKTHFILYRCCLTVSLLVFFGRTFIASIIIWSYCSTVISRKSTVYNVIIGLIKDFCVVGLVGPKLNQEVMRLMYHAKLGKSEGRDNKVLE